MIEGGKENEVQKKYRNGDECPDGSGNENNSVSKLVASVFLMIFVKSVEKKYLNQSRPTNCEFAISAK